MSTINLYKTSNLDINGNVLRDWIGDMYKMNTIKITDVGDATIENFSGMFAYMPNITNIDLSEFNSSNIKNLASCFCSCHNLVNLNLSNWNAYKVTNMSGMFDLCNNLTNLDILNWNTSNVTNMHRTFNYCYLIKNDVLKPIIENWDTSKVTDMSYMLAFTKNLKGGININTMNVTNMSYMFCNSGVGPGASIKLSNTYKVTNMHGMFDFCVSLFQLPTLEMSNVKDASSMFSNHNANLGGSPANLSSLLNTHNIKNTAYMFYNTGVIFWSTGLSGMLNMKNVTNAYKMFGNSVAEPVNNNSSMALLKSLLTAISLPVENRNLNYIGLTPTKDTVNSIINGHNSIVSGLWNQLKDNGWTVG